MNTCESKCVEETVRLRGRVTFRVDRGQRIPQGQSFRNAPLHGVMKTLQTEEFSVLPWAPTFIFRSL